MGACSTGQKTTIKSTQRTKLGNYLLLVVIAITVVSITVIVTKKEGDTSK